MPITHYLTCFRRDNASIMCVDIVFGSPIIQSVISGSHWMLILTPSPANEIINASSTEGTKTYHCVNVRASPKSKEIDHSQRSTRTKEVHRLHLMIHKKSTLQRLYFHIRLPVCISYDVSYISLNNILFPYISFNNSLLAQTDYFYLLNFIKPINTTTLTL